MGLFKTEHCIFTNLIATDYENGEAREAIEYQITIEDKIHLIRLHKDAARWHQSDDFFKQNTHLFNSLLQNDNWFDDENTFITLDKLKELLKEKDYPRTPQQKIEKLFLYLINIQEFDGSKIEAYNIFYNKKLWTKFYLKSFEECNFYLKTLFEQGLINVRFTSETTPITVWSLNVTYKGLLHAINLNEQGENSRKCFIAMSFDPSTKASREAIRQALIQTGYEAIIIDEQIIDSERTINDEIIASLKKCKFCIADFTLHSKGVYFESGFALGQGKKVIYTCSKEEFSKAHFDIKPLQHIVYETIEQLTKDLINKIEAYIN